MISKFRIGDKVITPFGSNATVIAVFIDHNNKRMKAKTKSTHDKFEQSWFQDELKFNNNDLKEKVDDVIVEIGDKCPKCEKEWHVTKFGSKIWYDCKTCNKTAEQLLETKKSIDWLNSF